MSQVRGTLLLFATQLVLKGSTFIKQLLLAFFLGISKDLDLMLVAQMVPTIISAILSGGAGEIMAINFRRDNAWNVHLLALSTFILVLMTVVANSVYLFSLPLLADLLNVKSENWKLFMALSSCVVIAKVPAAVTSSLQQFVYVRDKYHASMWVSVVSELLGIVFILLTASQYGVMSFAIALIISSSVNALGYLYLIRIKIWIVGYIRVWRLYSRRLKNTFMKIGMLGIQTGITHLSVFAERSIGFRYLSPGYVGAMNYAKSVTELPRVLLLSSILTTTYARQIKLKSEDENEYLGYTLRMNDLLSTLALIGQCFSIVFAPFILIVIYQRGAFTSDDIKVTLDIYQILTLGFVPGLMFGFLSRIMLIEGQNKAMLRFIVVKTITELFLMYVLVFQFSQGIPIAITIGKFVIVGLMIFYFHRRLPGIINVRRFVVSSLLLFMGSALLIMLNRLLIDSFLTLLKWQLFALFTPLIILFLYLTMKLLIRLHPDLLAIMPKFEFIRRIVR